MGVNGTHQNTTINYDIFYTCLAACGFILSTIGLTANTFLIYIFVTDKFFHKTNYFLMLISVISDTIANLVGYSSYSFISGTNPNYSSALISCKIFSYFILTSYAISIFNLTLIAFDRYMALVKPMNTFYRNYKKRILIICEIVIFLLSTLTTIPSLYFTGIDKQDTKLCDFPHITLGVSICLIIYAILFYISPSVSIAIFYRLIITNQQRYVRPGQCTPFPHDLRKQRLIKALIKISLAYVLSTCPNCLLLITLAVTQKSLLQIRNQNFAFYLMAMVGLSVTTSITIFNPLLYLKFDGNIAIKFKKMFCKRGYVVRDISTASITVSARTG